MSWRKIEGFRFPYRVSDSGIIQKHDGKSWVEIHPLKHGRTAKVRFRTNDGGFVTRSVGRIVWEKFIGPVPQGMVVQVKNGFRRDCAVENLRLTTVTEISHLRRNPQSKTVLKMDKKGNVVAFYSSAADAARANYCSESAMRSHCAGLVEDDYRMDGYKYRYEDMGGGRPKGRERNATKKE